MKKKQLNTTILLIAVIAIWGVLIYKVVSGLSSDDDISSIENTTPRFNKDKPIEKREEFELFIPERDPFLGIVINPPKRNVVKNTNPTKARNTGVDVELIWNGISYKGMLSNKSKNIDLFLFTYKGNEIILKLNQIHKEYKLIKADADKATLQYKSYRKEFIKE